VDAVFFLLVILIEPSVNDFIIVKDKTGRIRVNVVRVYSTTLIKYFRVVTEEKYNTICSWQPIFETRVEQGTSQVRSRNVTVILWSWRCCVDHFKVLWSVCLMDFEKSSTGNFKTELVDYMW